MRKHYGLFRKACFVLLASACALLPVKTSQAANEDGLKGGRKEFQFVEREGATAPRFDAGYQPTEEEKAYWTGFSGDYYYNQLTDGQKIIWDGLEADCVRLAAGTDYAESAAVQFDNNKARVSEEELFDVLFMFYCSNPQYYFLSNYYGYWSRGSIYTAVIDIYPDFYDGNARKNTTNTFCGKVNGWLNEIAGAGMEEQKVKAAHDIIARNTVYNFGYYDQSAYSMVCQGETVCMGYAAVMELLLNHSGIPAVTVTSAEHAWTIANVHGQWYNVDVTWDDTDSVEYEPVAYNYYLKSDVSMNADNNYHIAEEVWANRLPALNYDSTVPGFYYEPSYFDVSGFSYFKVNDNTALGQRCAAIVGMEDGMSMDLAMPTVDYNGCEYKVLGVAEGKRIVPHYDLLTVGGSWDGNQYYLPDGTLVKDAFFCDGTFTYYLMLDGMPMKDRLSYHPDGENVIYFDADGHEVFSNFANVKQSIAGEPVDDLCFFDTYGHQYVDVVTYDITGTKLYYANRFGVLERNGWFQFSDQVKCADGTPWPGAAGGYGYANADGTLMKDTQTFDRDGQPCYIQANGVVTYNY